VTALDLYVSTLQAYANFWTHMTSQLKIPSSTEAYYRLEAWIHFRARFDGVHAYGNNSAESEPIWMKSGVFRVTYILAGWPWQILGAIRAVARAGEPDKFLFFFSGKQRPIIPISRRPNFTKSEHNTSIGVAMNLFGAEFWKFPRKGSFFAQKYWIFQRLATSGRHNSAMCCVVYACVVRK